MAQSLSTNNIQSEFLSQIKSRLTDKVSFVDTLAGCWEPVGMEPTEEYGAILLSLDEAKTM